MSTQSSIAKFTSISTLYSVSVSKQSYCNRAKCYDSKLKVLSNETTLVLSNTRELDRVPSTK